MSERLEILRPVLSAVPGRFSAFSLGAGVESGLELEISREFDAVVVAAEKDPLRYTPAGRMVALRREFSPGDLEELARSEVFDVVLALNVLHWLGPDWRPALEALRALGENVLVQSPPAEDRKACGEQAVREIAQTLPALGRKLGECAQFPGHLPRPIWYLAGEPASQLTKKFFGAPSGEVQARVTGEGSLRKIRLEHKTPPETLDYIPGISLESFLALGGVWPRAEDLSVSLGTLAGADHRDLQAWNIRIDGLEAHAIDPGGRDWPDSDRENLSRLVERIGRIGRSASVQEL